MEKSNSDSSIGFAIPILYEDENYIIVDKPEHLPCDSTYDKGRAYLLGEVQKIRPNLQISAHHRLDVDTSGAVVFSKTIYARKVLDDLFKRHEIHKCYEGLVWGDFSTAGAGKIEWQSFLKEDKIRSGKKTLDKMVSVKSGGKKAITFARSLQSSPWYSRVEFQILTGRKHQIRAQAAQAGFPLVGDHLYGGALEAVLEEKAEVLLHARELAFTDPLSGKEIKVNAPLPNRFQKWQELFSNFKLILLNKPYAVLSQFSGESENLSQFQLPQDVYSIGRLDKDSEGMLLLTNHGGLKNALQSPSQHKSKVYWVLVEGQVNKQAVTALVAGVKLNDGMARAVSARILSAPQVEMYSSCREISSKRFPHTSWLEIVLDEGRNRQVRRMTAAVGLPTLRLLRIGFGSYFPNDLKAGAWRSLTFAELIMVWKQGQLI